MCVPNSKPMMDLLDEGTVENQGLNYVAFYPSESCLVKMLYRTGFPFVYRFKRLPEDKQFSSSLCAKTITDDSGGFKDWIERSQSRVGERENEAMFRDVRSLEYYVVQVA